MNNKKQLIRYSLLVFLGLVYLSWHYIPTSQIHGTYIFRTPKSEIVVPSPIGHDQLILENNGDFHSTFYGSGHYEVISRGWLKNNIELTVKENGQSRRIELIIKRGLDFRIQLVFFPGSDVLYRKVW